MANVQIHLTILNVHVSFHGLENVATNTIIVRFRLVTEMQRVLITTAVMFVSVSIISYQ